MLSILTISVLLLSSCQTSKYLSSSGECKIGEDCDDVLIVQSKEKQDNGLGAPVAVAPSGPFDTALAEITILSLQDDTAKIEIEKIRSYYRYPDATYQKLNVDDEIDVRVFDTLALRTVLDSDEEPAIREDEEPAEVVPPSTPPVPKPVVGEKYLASMNLCIVDNSAGIDCEYDGWSIALYPLSTE